VKFLDDALISVDPFLHCRRSDGLERGNVNITRDRVCAARRRKAVDDKVDLTKVFFNQINHTIFKLGRERIAIDALRIKPSFICISVKRS